MESNYVSYCKALIEGLCTNSNIEVRKQLDERGVLLQVTGISVTDMPSVIGSKGQHVNAIRLLVKAAGLREGARIALKVAEPDITVRKLS